MKQTSLTVPYIIKALHNPKFRQILAGDYTEELQSFDKDPNCLCHHKFYRLIATKEVEAFRRFYPELGELETSNELREDNWHVINCSVEDVLDQLRKLPPGKKQVALARYEDQVTIVVNEFDPNLP